MFDSYTTLHYTTILRTMPPIQDSGIPGSESPESSLLLDLRLETCDLSVSFESQTTGKQRYALSREQADYFPRFTNHTLLVFVAFSSRALHCTALHHFLAPFPLSFRFLPFLSFPPKVIYALITLRHAMHLHVYSTLLPIPLLPSERATASHPSIHPPI